MARNDESISDGMLSNLLTPVSARRTHICARPSRRLCQTGAVLRPPVRVCFVCSGNICRSPTAEVVLNRLAGERGRSDLVAADSAGTGSWHEGDDMDERSRGTLVDAGYDVPLHVAKQFQPADFARRDLIVALDGSHRDVLWWLAAETGDPATARAKIVLLRAFDPDLGSGESADVADPYYGGRGGFGEVLEHVERSAAAMLTAIERAVDAGADLVVPGGQQPESPPR
jgi:protein-tyrosine phosphatase